MEQLIEVIGENFSAILSGFFVIVGSFFGWFLTLLTTKYQDRIQLAFAEEGTPNDELIERELRTKTSSSECSIRIYNVGNSACFLENIFIMRQGYCLVECFDVSGDHGAIAPNSSMLYTLMQQDADALQYNYSEYYKKPNKLYLDVMYALRKIPVIRNCISDPLFKQSECKVIAYTVNGKRIRGKIDLPFLYIRHTTANPIVEV